MEAVGTHEQSKGRTIWSCEVGKRTVLLTSVPLSTSTTAVVLRIASIRITWEQVKTECLAPPRLINSVAWGGA